LQNGATVWFSGLSGAGKTTICRLLATKLKQADLRLEWLDGDEIRRHFSSNLGYGREERIVHIQRIAYMCKLLSRNGVLVLASFITPYQEMRDYCRKEIGAYHEVYVKCALEQCILRDVKGLYAKALSDGIEHFTGISDPFEEPANPDLILETDRETEEESVSKVMIYLQRHGYI
jgi:adenylylsulfate kinase